MSKLNQFKLFMLVVISALIYYLPQSMIKGLMANPDEMSFIFSLVSVLLILFIWALFVIFLKGFDE